MAIQKFNAKIIETQKGYICDMQELNKHIKELTTLCDQYNVESLYVFGSASSDTLKSSSDIDLLVKFKPFDLSKYVMNYMEFKERLNSLFKRDIDLVEEQSLKNPILIKSINRTKEHLYG